MTYKQQKQRLQICVTLKDLSFIDKFAEKTGAKNASEAIHEIIYDYELMQNSIDNFKRKLYDAQSKQSYEEVRTEQIKKTQNEVPPGPPSYDPLNDPKWFFLKAKPEDPNLKSVVKYKREKK